MCTWAIAWYAVKVKNDDAGGLLFFAFLADVGIFTTFFIHLPKMIWGH